MSPKYLGLALAGEIVVGETTVRHHEIAKLRLPTGRLVATDAFVFLDAKPFNVVLPAGVFPVILSVEHSGNDQRVAFASIRFRDSLPVRWEMLTVGDQDLSTLKDGYVFAYGVDSGTGCFIDASAAKVLEARMAANPEFFQEMMAEMDRTYVHTWSWLDMPFGDGNLVAFSSGLGDGAYATYAGFDAGGEICVVVTDFDVVPSEKI